MFPLLFLSYIYIDICSIKFFMFSIYVVSGISFFCHKQEPYLKETSDWDEYDFDTISSPRTRGK